MSRNFITIIHKYRCKTIQHHQKCEYKMSPNPYNTRLCCCSRTHTSQMSAPSSFIRHSQTHLNFDSHFSAPYGVVSDIVSLCFYCNFILLLQISSATELWFSWRSFLSHRVAKHYIQSTLLRFSSARVHSDQLTRFFFCKPTR